MQITVVNNSTTPVPMPGDVTCAVGATRTVTGRTATELEHTQQNYGSSTVLVFGTLEGLDSPPLVCSVKDPGDVGAAGTTKAACGFDLLTASGAVANEAPAMYFGAFDDAAYTVPAANATLDTAAAGTIDAGGGTNLLEVTPSAAGVLSVTLTDAVDETVYLKAWPKSTADRAIDCSGFDTVAFSA